MAVSKKLEKCIECEVMESVKVRFFCVERIERAVGFWDDKNGRAGSR
ncbi:hypothetical protein COLO4_23631 [Corchorus olitorius]|uniref:Uncharacterized protein n=1 Tax=Corchorus olitorius TaxID=93759 RepID=A0A1R3IFN7_9ROSI|nr:hypothetical protein COLO4_23631 [Corchorus olitorius]